MRDINTLQQFEVIRIRTAKEAKKIIALCHNLAGNKPNDLICSHVGKSDIGFYWMDIIDSRYKVLPASDFLPRKNKLTKKWVRNEIAKSIKVNEPQEVKSDQPQEIDFSKAGQLVTNTYGSLWLTTGEHNGNEFYGVILHKGDSFGRRLDVRKQNLKLYTGEPITLSNV